ncbi:uncharacterized protein LOC103041110 isoform X7 [Astyanax mexicanus]|uniref:uncharacterized protein LOC103041110 isoform X7 n=1 Tax=Astyanax mexicanus TaxID=7994 RepID=UPI000BBDB3D8|nr:uncharacterized protein LOC103041110 isoform X7 [Astyanax mexicanus]
MNRNGDTASIFFYSLCSEVYSWSVFGALFSHTAGGTGSAELQKVLRQQSSPKPQCPSTIFHSWDEVLRFLPSVRIGNNTSSTTILRTGAPHSCVLSPLLFTAKYSSNHIIKIADDKTVFGLINKNDESEYREEVQ